MGTRSLTAIKLNVKLSATVQNMMTDGGVTSIGHPALDYKPTLTSGIGNNMANRGWQASGTIGIGDIEVFDLHDMGGMDIGAGAGNDGLGQEVDFENINAIAIVNDNAVGDTGQLEVYPSPSHGWTGLGEHTVANGGALKGQGLLLKTCVVEGGFDVDPAAAADYRLTLRAMLGSVNYSIYILASNDDTESSSSSSSLSSSSPSSNSISTSSSSVTSSSSSSSLISSASASSASSTSSSHSASSVSASSTSSSHSSSSVSP